MMLQDGLECSLAGNAWRAELVRELHFVQRLQNFRTSIYKCTFSTEEKNPNFLHVDQEAKMRRPQSYLSHTH